jgi:transcriptional regulator NrdR family protein
MSAAMETNPEISDRCPLCKRQMLSVLYYGADGESVGGHRICPDCGPRSTVELVVPDELRRKLLERKAS